MAIQCYWYCTPVAAAGADTTNFAVIDVTSGEVLLGSNQRLRGNEAEAKKIFGKEIVLFSCSIKNKKFFNSTASGELCFRSGGELG